MKNDELLFDDGLVSYSINGKDAHLIINPTDANFFGDVYDAFASLSALKENSDAKRKEIKPEEVFDFLRDVDAKMRGVIDKALGPYSDAASVCETAFGSMNLYSYGNGLPIWCNFLFAVMDKADSSITQQQKLTDPRIAKYTAKYHR